MPNRYQRLVASITSSTAEIQLYAVPVGTQIVSVLRICNQSSDEKNYSVAHTYGAGSSTSADWLVCKKGIVGNDVHEISICGSSGEYVRIRTSTENKISFGLEGLKIGTS